MCHISKYLLICLGLTSCLISACDGCLKGDNCPSRLVYKIPFTLSPQKDTFKIGIDTIWIEANFDGTLVDTNGILNTFDGCDFMIELTIGKIDTTPSGTNTVDLFPIIAFTGEVKPKILSNLGISFYEVKPIFINKSYKLKIGLFPQSQGLFSLSIAPLIYKQLDCTLINKCKKTAYIVYSGMNNGVENNFRFLKNSPALEYSTTKKVDFDNGGAYIFYVK